MAQIPIRHQLFQAFLGVHEGIHAIPLPIVYSSDGSKNVWIDKFGRVSQMRGYAAQNSTAVTTDTGADTTRVAGLIPYRDPGDLSRTLIGVFTDDDDEYELWSSTDEGDTWSFEKQLTLAGGATLADVYVDHAQFDDDLYLTGGDMGTPQVYNGSSVSDVGQTQSPQPSAAAGSAGLLNGTYKWKLVSVEADGTRHAGSDASTAIQLSEEEADLTWTADSDMDVVGYELYRTTGSGVVYYLSAFIDGRTTAAYTDAKSDLELLEGRSLQEHGDPPQANSRFVEAHKQRMWWAGDEDEPQRVYFSDPANPDSVGGDNFLEFQDSESVGDAIQGLFGNFEGFLVVFQLNSIWTVSGTGLIIGNIRDWNVRRSNAQTGTVQTRSIQRIPAGARYVDQAGEEQSTTVVTLAYWTPYGDIRLFDGENDLIISIPVKDTIGGYDYSNRKSIHSLHDAQQGQVTWFFPDSGGEAPADQANRAVTWNYRWGVWNIWEPMQFSSSAFIETSSDAQILLVGDSAEGTVYEFFKEGQFTFAGSDIDSRWMTKPIYGQGEGGVTIANNKRWRWADLVFADQDSVTATVEWFEGYDTGSASPQGSDTVSTQAAANKSGVQAHITLLDSSGRYLHSEGVRLRISADASNGPWRLEGMMLGYQELPSTRRRITV